MPSSAYLKRDEGIFIGNGIEYNFKKVLRDFVKNNLPVLIGRCPILIDYALSELLRLKLNFQSIEALKGRRRLEYGNAILTGKYFLQIPLP